MIVVDTSALMALLLGEEEADRVADTLEAATRIAICGGTLAEALIVSRNRGVGDEMARLVAGLAMSVAPLSEEGARRVADAYDTWGKGRHPAGLNFGDCFAYALAAAEDVPLLYVGDDFARTNIAAA